MISKSIAFLLFLLLVPFLLSRARRRRRRRVLSFMQSFSHTHRHTDTRTLSERRGSRVCFCARGFARREKNLKRKSFINI